MIEQYLSALRSAKTWINFAFYTSLSVSGLHIMRYFHFILETVDVILMLLSFVATVFLGMLSSSVNDAVNYRSREHFEYFCERQGWFMTYSGMMSIFGLVLFALYTFNNYFL